MDTKNDVLKYALDNGMIDLSYIQEQIRMSRRKELLEKHPYEIWQGNDGKTRTYLPDQEKGRRLVNRNNKEDVEDAIVKYWEKEEKNPTIDDLFKEWLSKKLEREEITKTTRDRYIRQYKESFTEFGKMRIKEISEYDIEDFMITTLHEKNMTAKGFSNFRTLIFGIFKYAKKNKYISYSITELVNDIEISRKSFRKNNHSNEEVVFNEKELPQVLEYLKKNNDIVNIGLLIMFNTGLRVGELAALKCEDVKGNSIHVQRTEVRYKEGDKYIYEVRDFPKTEAGIRDVIFPNIYMRYIEMAITTSSGEYLFELNGKRIRTYQFRQRLRTVCKHTNIIIKSPHKARMTYASVLIDNGVTESMVISQMGHTDIKTTKSHYYKNRNSTDKTSAVINSLPEFN